MNTASHWTALGLAAALGGDFAEAQTTERVSVNSAGAQANSAVDGPAISADGRYVLFFGNATNLVSGDTNGVYDIFVRDRLAGTVERASVSSAGMQGNGFSFFGTLSADGRFAAFMSESTNLVAGDTNGATDTFVHDLLSGTTELADVSSAGVQGDNGSGLASLSADGRFVAFDSGSTNLVAGDVNQDVDVFVRDRLNGTTELVSLNSYGAQGSGYNPSISADGRFVAFVSAASNLVAGDTNQAADIFVRDRLNGTTECISVDSNGALGNQASDAPAISADGRFVVFLSDATNLVAGDTNGVRDVFVHDRLTGRTERVDVSSSGAQANGSSGIAANEPPAISADGRFVTFGSIATNLVAGDSNGRNDVFLRDRLAGTTERVNTSSTGQQDNDLSFEGALSADGRFVAFSSLATNLVAGDTNNCCDVFVHDRGAPLPLAFCFGDGSAASCPCGNNGLAGHGCQNSSGTGGAVLGATGQASLSNDSLVLGSSGELASALSVFLQGDVPIDATSFGDGLRCAGGALKRLYVRNASGGGVSLPQAGDASISARSAVLGDAIEAGTTRCYQVYYRDPVLSFCPGPAGNSWNVSSGLALIWAQ